MRRSAQRKNLKNKNKRTYLYIFISLIVLLLGFLIFKYWPKNWDKSEKFIVVHQEESGDVAVDVIDLPHEELTTIIIPSRTEVEVSRNLGVYTIGNVWKLGANEGLSGSLLTETIVNNFSLPVYLYTDGKSNSNMTAGDRLMYKYYLSKYKSGNSSVIDLGKSQFIKKQKLNDGETGFRLEGFLSPRIAVFFTDPNFTDSDSRVGIINATKKGQGEISGKLDNITNLVGVMGAKVTSIQKWDDSKGEVKNCQVYGDREKAVKKLSQIFNCKITTGEAGFSAVIVVDDKLLSRI